MKHALVFAAATLISTAAIADGGNLIGSGTRSGPIVGGNSTYMGSGNGSPYMGGGGGRVDGEDDGDASRGSGFMGGGYRSGLLTGSNSSGWIGTGGRSISLRLERIK